MSVSKSYAYPPTSPGARAVTREMTLYPISGSVFNPQGVIRLQVPLNMNQFLNFSESYLSFTVSNPGAGANTLDHSAFSLFSRATVYAPNGEVLEDIVDVGRLFTLLYDAQVDQSYRNTAMGAMLGCAPITDASNNPVILRQGITVAALAGGVAGTANLACPLPCGLGLNAKAFPAAFLPGGYLRIDLTLADTYTPFTAPIAAATQWTVSNVAYRVPYTQFDDMTVQMIKAAAGPSVHYPLFSFLNYSATVAAAAGQSIVVGTRCRSALYMVGSFWNLVKAQATSTNRIVGNRCSNGVTSLQLRVNGDMYPTQALQTYPQILGEVTKVFRDFSNVYQGSSLSSAEFDDSAVAGNGSFMWAIDLKTQPESVALGETFVGMNLTSADITLQLTLATAEGTQLSGWVCCNKLVDIQPDGRILLLQ